MPHWLDGLLIDRGVQSRRGLRLLGLLLCVCAVGWLWPVAAMADSPPSISASFAPTSVPLNGTSHLTVTITDPATNTSPATGYQFSGTIPAGLAVSDVSSSACGGMLTVTAGARLGVTYSTAAFALSGATVNPGASCQFSLSVTAVSAGSYTVTSSVFDPNNGTGRPVSAASATLVLPATAIAPTATVSLGSNAIPLGGMTSIAITITNPNPTTSLSGLALEAISSLGLVFQQLTANSCGGSAVAQAFLSPDDRGPGIYLNGGSLAAGATCTVSGTLTGTLGAQYSVNALAAADESGPGANLTAPLAVIRPPAVAAVFTPAAITAGKASTLTIVIADPNTQTVLGGPASSALSAIGLSAALSAGLQIADPTNATDTCGGTLSARAGTNAVHVSGAQLQPGAICKLAISVTAATPGSYQFSTGPVSSSEGGTAPAAAAGLNVAAPPSNRIEINSSRTAHDGTATVRLSAPGPGTLRLRETTIGRRRELIATVTRELARGGRVVLTARPSKQAEHRFNRTHSQINVVLAISYTPAGGTSRTITIKQHRA